MFTIAETCACGAHISLQGSLEYLPIINKQIDAWHEEHKPHAGRVLDEKEKRRTERPWPQPSVRWDWMGSGYGQPKES